MNEIASESEKWEKEERRGSIKLSLIKPRRGFAETSPER